MKKILFALLAVALCLVSCKKDQTVTPTGESSTNGTATATEVTLPNNQQAGESVSATMPKSAIIGALKLTEDEFNTAWSNGQISFGACQANDHNNIYWDSTLGQGKWGHYFDASGKVCQSESGAVVCIEGNGTAFTYVISGEGDFSELTGKTITCTQVFQYKEDLMTTTVFVPWTISIEKGDVRILEYCGSTTDVCSYEAALTDRMTAINYSNIDDVVGFDPADSAAVLIIDGKVDMSTKSDTLYVNLDGTAAADTTTAAAVIFKNADKKWHYRLMANEVAEGKKLEVNLGFVNEEKNIAAGYTIKGEYTERTFAKVVDSTFSMNTGIAYSIKMLATNRERTTEFDLPASAYKALADMAAAKGQAGVTLAQLILGNWILVQGGADKAECTAEPYGHWFDANSKVCTVDDNLAYIGLIHNPNKTTGHSPITLQNVPGSNKAGDTFTCQQFYYSTALSVTIPITFTIKVVESVSAE